MLGRLLGEDIALQLNYSKSPATIEADAGMMEQVLLNLAVNARDAMPRGGQLAIRISIVEVDDAHVQRHHEARAGTFRLHQQVRHRLRHSAGKSFAHLRAVFHHQGNRQRHRPRPRHRLWHRQAASRLDRSRERRRQGHNLSHLPSVHRHRAARCGKTHDTDRHSRRHRNHPARRGRTPRARTRRPRPPKIRLQNLAGRQRRRRPRRLARTQGRTFPCCSPTSSCPAT